MNDEPKEPRPMRSDHWRIEARYLPEDLGDLAELRRRIIDAGYPAQVANGVLGWLVSKMAGERDATSSDTRSRYRKILAELGYDPTDVDQAPPPETLTPAAADQRRRLKVIRGLPAVVALVGASLAGVAHRGAPEASSGALSGSRENLANVANAENPRSKRSVKQRWAKAA